MTNLGIGIHLRVC